MKQKLGVTGRVTVEVDGRSVLATHNLITNAGLAQLAALLNGVSTLPAKYIALGTGNSPADPGDTTLETEVTAGGGARVLGTTSRTTTVVTDDTAVIQASFAITVDLSLTELGLFSAISAGVLLSHVTFSPVAVSNGQTLVVTWNYAVEETAV